MKHTAVCPELDRTEETAFMAVITTKNYGRLLCVGSILDEYHVLTARSCFDKSDAATLTVIAGYQSPYWGKNSQVKYAEKIILHKDKELAIIVLRKPFDFTSTVKPIKIIGPEKMNDEFEESYPPPYAVVGFEVPEYLEQPALIPRTISYHMIDEKFEKCDEKCHKFQDDKLYFCTDGKAGFNWGGMGSPTIIPVQKEFVLVGVLFNYKCTVEKEEEPAQQPPPAQPTEAPELPVHHVHIRADRFYKWIKANSYVGR